MLVCNTQHVEYWLLYIACRAFYVTKHEYDTTLCNWAWLRCVCVLETEHIIPSNFNFSKLTFLALILIIIFDCKIYSFHRKQDNDDCVTCPVNRKVHLSIWWLYHMCAMTTFCILCTRYRACSMLCSALYILDLARGGTMHVCANTLCVLCWSQEATWMGVDSTDVVTLYRVIMPFLFPFLI